MVNQNISIDFFSGVGLKLYLNNFSCSDLLDLLPMDPLQLNDSLSRLEYNELFRKIITIGIERSGIPVKQEGKVEMESLVDRLYDNFQEDNVINRLTLFTALCCFTKGSKQDLLSTVVPFYYEHSKLNEIGLTQYLSIIFKTIFIYNQHLEHIKELGINEIAEQTCKDIFKQEGKNQLDYTDLSNYIFHNYNIGEESTHTEPTHTEPTHTEPSIEEIESEYTKIDKNFIGMEHGDLPPLPDSPMDFSPVSIREEVMAFEKPIIKNGLIDEKGNRSDMDQLNTEVIKRPTLKVITNLDKNGKIMESSNTNLGEDLPSVERIAYLLDKVDQLKLEKSTVSKKNVSEDLPSVERIAYLLDKVDQLKLVRDRLKAYSPISKQKTSEIDSLPVNKCISVRDLLKLKQSKDLVVYVLNYSEKIKIWNYSLQHYDYKRRSVWRKANINKYDMENNRILVKYPCLDKNLLGHNEKWLLKSEGEQWLTLDKKALNKDGYSNHSLFVFMECISEGILNRNQKSRYGSDLLGESDLLERNILNTDKLGKQYELYQYITKPNTPILDRKVNEYEKLEEGRLTPRVELTVSKGPNIEIKDKGVILVEKWKKLSESLLELQLPDEINVLSKRYDQLIKEWELYCQDHINLNNQIESIQMLCKENINENEKLLQPITDIKEGDLVLTKRANKLEAGTVLRVSGKRKGDWLIKFKSDGKCYNRRTNSLKLIESSIDVNTLKTDEDVEFRLTSPIKTQCKPVKRSKRLIQKKLKATSSLENWYYWSDVIVNELGETLTECVQKYGIGGWCCLDKDMKAQVIYLDDQLDFSNSWLLCCRHNNKSTLEESIPYQENGDIYKKSGIITEHLKGKIHPMVVLPIEIKKNRKSSKRYNLRPRRKGDKNKR